MVGITLVDYLVIVISWYHMHVKVSRTLHAHEICEMWHTWLCDLVITCIVNFGECKRGLVDYLVPHACKSV
jgi:hypothetical protein